MSQSSIAEKGVVTAQKGSTGSGSGGTSVEAAGTLITREPN